MGKTVTIHFIKTWHPDFDNSIAFNAAKELVIEGTKQPSGYTEPVLHKYRLLKKAQMA